MYVVDEGKSKVLEIGVYVLESLGSVGLPADLATQALLRLKHSSNPAHDGDEGGDTLRGGRQRLERLKTSSGKPRKRRRRKARQVEERRRQQQQQQQKMKRQLQLMRQQQQQRRGDNENVLQRVLRLVMEAKSSTPQQLISRVLFYLADVLGDPLDSPSQEELQRAFGELVEQAQGRTVHISARVPRPLSQQRAVAGIVLSYRERDDVALPSEALHRLRRGMHFEIPLRPFDATVQLLPPPAPPCSPDSGLQRQHSFEDAQTPPVFSLPRRRHARESPDAQDVRCRRQAEAASGAGAAADADHSLPPCTPQSFPPTPQSRRALLADYSAFTENVLWRARDELRGEQQRNSRSRLAIFNPDDAHPKVALSCGGHCAALALPTLAVVGVEQEQDQAAGQGACEQQTHQQQTQRAADIYRSVRAALPVAPKRPTYFEVCPLPLCRDNAEVPEDVLLGTLRLCVGVASRKMPLRNAFAGLGPESAGLDASGVLLAAPKRSRARGFGLGSVVGVLVRPGASRGSYAMFVSFFVDGKPAALDEDGRPASVCVRCASDDVELYPALSIRSRGVRAFGHFSAADMRPANDDPEAHWAPLRALCGRDAVFALDGTIVLHNLHNESAL